MGRVRTKTIKRAARQIVNHYYTKLSLDFQINKLITQEVADIPTKRMRNKIAGFTTHLMKRMVKGPVRGVSIKLQEEERERKMDVVPDQSVLEVETVQVEPETYAMLQECKVNVRGISVTVQTRA